MAPLKPSLSPRLVFSLFLASALCTAASAQKVGAVFVIDLENHNWTQDNPSGPEPLRGNPAAPFINSLVAPGSPNSAMVSFASHYHNVLSTPSGNNPSIHPSEPNYIWQEAGSNLGVLNDNEPYGSGRQVRAISAYLAEHPAEDGEHLCGLLQAAGIPWKSYEEDIDLRNDTGGNGNLGGDMTNGVLPRSQWTVPLKNRVGSSPSYRNPYNGSDQYGFVCKHNGPLFFTDTNASSAAEANTLPSNPEVSHYAPLQQLACDLADNSVARYNLITPDLCNDMHDVIAGGFTYHGTHYFGDQAAVAQGDNFLSILVPQIMASEAFKQNGVIIIWTDETEGSNPDNFGHTLTEIVISPLARGHAFNVSEDLTHSSDLATMQEVFGVRAHTRTGYLNDAANPSHGSQTTDLADFFLAGVIPPSL